MNYWIGLYVPVILYNLFCSVCNVSLYRYSNGIYAQNSKKYSNNYSSILHIITIDNRKYSNIKLSRSINIGKAISAIVDNDEYCTNMYVCNNDTTKHDFDTSLHYDTLIQSDIVRNQYMTLPYPAVSEEELMNEKVYYDKIYNTAIRKVPYTITYGTTFEALNHYLYRGRNTFRSAYIRSFEQLKYD